MELTPALIERTRALETPCLVIDRALIRDYHERLARVLPGVDVYYAVKANSHFDVLRTVAGLGCGFEISSEQELEMALATGVSADRIISGNPIKPPSLIRRAHELGLRGLAFDSVSEVCKLAQLAPSSELYLRLTVDNSGSEWPLSKKYGVDLEEALPLLQAAKAEGLKVAGVTFHVGSQCTRAASWRDALRLCRGIFDQAESLGTPMSTINLGGGLPVRHTKPVPELSEIGDTILETVSSLFPERPRLIMEPGRALVGDAGMLVSTVIGKAQRHNERWLYLDAGVFNALMETTGGFRYELRTERTGPARKHVVAGPSCDSVDVMWTDAELPELGVGDRVYIMNAGAYTLSYASSFNGFPPPEVAIVG